MKFCITPNSFEAAKKLIVQNCDCIILSLANFANCANYYANLSEIKQLIQSKNKTKIFVKINNFIFENQIETLTEVLKELSKIQVDKILFNDYAIAQINYELNLNLNLHYHPNTLLTSYHQFPFFLENKIFGASLANELFIHEIKQICENKPSNFELLIQGHGHCFIMHSRWNLVTNFQKYVNDEINEYSAEKQILIKELNKVYPNLIYQDETGTFMFSGYELCLLKHLNTLKEYGVDYVLIDTFLNKTIDADIKLNTLYKQTVQTQEITNIYKQIQSISNNELSDGFIGGVNGIKHLLKKEEK